MNLYTRTLASIAVAWSIAASGQSVKNLSGTIGFQFGGQVYRQIIFFQDQSAYDDFTDANFEFDAQASAVAVTASAQASSGTQGSQTSVAAASSGELSGAETYYNGMRG